MASRGDQVRSRSGCVACMVTVLPTGATAFPGPLHIVSAELSEVEVPGGTILREWQSLFLARSAQEFMADMPGPLLLGVSASSTPRSSVYHILRTGYIPRGPRMPDAPLRPAAIPLSCSSVRLAWLPVTRRGEGDAPVSRYRVQIMVVAPTHAGLPGTAGMPRLEFNALPEDQLDDGVVDGYDDLASLPSQWDADLEPETAGTARVPEAEDLSSLPKPPASTSRHGLGAPGRTPRRGDALAQAIVIGGPAQAANRGQVAGPALVSDCLAGRAGGMASVEALQGRSDPVPRHGLSVSASHRIGRGNGSLWHPGVSTRVAGMGGGKAFLDCCVVSADARLWRDPVPAPSDAASLSLDSRVALSAMTASAAAEARHSALTRQPGGAAATAAAASCGLVAGPSRSQLAGARPQPGTRMSAELPHGGIAGHPDAPAPPAGGHGSDGASLDGTVTTVITGLASATFYQFRVIAVTALGESPPSEPSLLVRTPQSIAESARQAKMAAGLAASGITGAHLSAAELRALGAVGEADRRAAEEDEEAARRFGLPVAPASRPTVSRHGTRNDAARHRAACGPSTSMARQRLPADDEAELVDPGSRGPDVVDWQAPPPGGSVLWGRGPADRRAAAQARAEQAEARAQEREEAARRRQRELEKATVGMAAAEATAVRAFAQGGVISGARRMRNAPATDEEELRLEEAETEAAELAALAAEAGDGFDLKTAEGRLGWSLSQTAVKRALSDLPARSFAATLVPMDGLRHRAVEQAPEHEGEQEALETSSVEARPVTARGSAGDRLLEAVPDAVEAAAMIRAERAARQTQASSLLHGVRPAAAGWKTATYSMSAGGGATEMELRSAKALPVRVLSAPQPAGLGHSGLGATLGDDLRSVGVTSMDAAVAVRVALGTAAASEGLKAGSAAAAASSASQPAGGDSSVALASRLRPSRPVVAPAEWQAPPAQRADPGAARRAAADPTGATQSHGLAALRSLMDDVSGGGATPRAEDGTETPVRPSSNAVTAPSSALDATSGEVATHEATWGRSDAGAESVLWTGVDPIAERFCSLDRSAKLVHRLNLASAYECYRYLLPPDDPDALPVDVICSDARQEQDAVKPAGAVSLSGVVVPLLSGGPLGSLDDDADHRGDDDTDDAGSFDCYPSSTHRAVIGDEDRSEADDESHDGKRAGHRAASPAGVDEDGVDPLSAFGASTRVGPSARAWALAGNAEHLSGSRGAATIGMGTTRTSQMVPSLDEYPSERMGESSRLRPTPVSGLPAGVVQNAKMAPQRHRAQLQLDARLARLIHDDHRWEPCLGMGEPLMTVLAPPGTPGSQGIDDTPCIPKQIFRRTVAYDRAYRGDTGANGGSVADGGKSIASSEDGSSIDDGRQSSTAGSVSDGSQDRPLAVACTDYILYSRQQLQLESLARLPCSLTEDEVPDPLAATAGTTMDDDVLPNSVNASHHLPLVAWFSVLEGAVGITNHAGYRG